MIGGLYTYGVWTLIVKVLPGILHLPDLLVLAPIWLGVSWIGGWLLGWADGDYHDGGLGNYEPNATDPSAF